MPELRHAAQAMGAVHLLARLDGRAVGCGLIVALSGGRAVVEADVSVAPADRRRGIGTALLHAISARALEVGGEELQGEVREGDDESLGFVRRRGFVEVERQKEVVLDLAGAEVGALQPPAGIAIVPRGERPGLERAEYELVQAAHRDIPGLDADVERVVGSASIVVIGGTAYHGLTAVARAYRGRGVAEALKRAQIAAARDRGFARLVTESQQDNLPMRRLNEKLGYRPAPGAIVVRGPLQLTPSGRGAPGAS
jgi:ribosomal protein S18 acetylase RimI-like enzyme